jgi:L-fucose isomerase-like protein
MAQNITYLAYGENIALRERSIEILNTFFQHEPYNLQQQASPVLFIASGGSEQFAKEASNSFRNIILLCHRENNSFAASMEIAAYLRKQLKRVTIIDVLAAGAFQKYSMIRDTYKALDSLAGQKAALIGDVSDWLIISDIDQQLVKEKLGIELIHLPWSSLNHYQDKEPSTEFLQYFPQADAMSLNETARVYQLLTEVIQQHGLSAISVECFSMVRRDSVTACLPLAVLNSKQVVAACEGDICSMIGKMLIRAASGMVPWQANVAEITDDSILFAHCTVPLNMIASFNITTHYETDCGTAIQGKFEMGEVAAFRINNALDQFMLLQGEIAESPSQSFACRTQMRFLTDDKQTNLLLKNSLGNHHLLFSAKHIAQVEHLMAALGIDRVA